MAKTNPKKKTSNLTKYNRAGYFFVAPFVIVFLIFSVYPVFRTLVLSFTDSKLAGMPYHFVGLKNYTRVFTDKFFWRALWNTIRIWGVNIVLQLGLAFLLTVVFSDIKYKFKGLPVFRALYYLPNLIAATSVAFLFKTLLDWRYGTFNQILNSVSQFFGVNKAPVDWLGNSGTTGNVIAVISAWMWFGNSFIMLMAGVQGINKDYFEAAAIDGAGRWTTFGKITLPLLKPIMLYVAITSLIGGLQMFDLPFLMSEKTAASYYDRYTDPEYFRWLKVFRQLGEEGYLANDIFVDTRTQMEEKVAQGRYFCMLYQYSDMLTQQKILYANDPDSIYMAVEGPRNANGDDPLRPTTTINGWTVTLISKNCKHPERAIAFLDYLMSEHGQLLTYLGVEGVTYDIKDGKPVLRDNIKQILDTDRAAYDREYGADDAYWMLQDNVMQLQWKQEPSPATAQLEEWGRKYVVYNGQYDVVFDSGSKEASEEDKITKLWSQTLPALLMAPSEEEFDTLFEEFIEKRDELGYTDVMEKKTAYMNSAKEKLGIQ